VKKAPLIVLVVVLIGAGAFAVFGRAIWYPMLLRITGPRTVADVIARYGPAARSRLLPHFRKAGMTYPPKRVALLVFKEERRLAVWARGQGPWRYIHSWPILAASGYAGPKLREGDRQVPEGLYRIEHLNPNSSYHLSMKVDYPNAFDREVARRDGRTRLGGDIFIHGKRVSVGCVALGDPGIEDLFTLVADTGHPRVQIIIAPNDLRRGGAVMPEAAPRWTSQLHARLAAALREFPAWMESDSAIDVRGMPKAIPRFQ
jgi:hypothetical protein